MEIARKALIILTILSTLQGCKNELSETEFTNIYILIDVTESKLVEGSLLQSSISEILQTIDVSTSHGGVAGCEIKIFTINDLSNSKSITVKLQPGMSGLLGQNPLDRIDEIKTFEEELSSAFMSIHNKVSEDKNQSKIYQNICREINHLISKEYSNNKIFIIFSDMLENSDLFSFYNMDELQRIKYNIPEFINNTLEKDCTLPDLSPLEIYIVNNRTLENDDQINIAESFWKEIFASKNAKVIFDSELDLNK